MVDGSKWLEPIGAPIRRAAVEPPIVAFTPHTGHRVFTTTAPSADGSALVQSTYFCSCGAVASYVGDIRIGDRDLPL